MNAANYMSTPANKNTFSPTKKLAMGGNHRRNQTVTSDGQLGGTFDKIMNTTSSAGEVQVEEKGMTFSQDEILDDAMRFEAFMARKK